jgi:hypothetical protein
MFERSETLKRSPGAKRFNPSQHILAWLNGVIPMATQHRGARWDKTRFTNDVLGLARVELFPFRCEPDIPDRELLELAAGEITKDLLMGCRCTRDVMDQIKSVSIIYLSPQI